ncbi:MAG TPA: DUF4124 domain-containing protein [Gammaproteobacteria bacterium]|nr:DUF4124 domain-containing protein [Gammaproteobacteria bacterium]
MALTENITFDASRGRGRLLAIALGIASFTLLQAGLAAGVYRWVDERGEVHYGDRPPSKKESAPVEIKSAPAPAQEDGKRRLKTQRLLDALESERNRKKQEAAQARADKARQRHNCQIARRQAALYQRANNISRRGPDGERTYLNDEERSQALARARIRVDKWCK